MPYLIVLLIREKLLFNCLLGSLNFESQIKSNFTAHCDEKFKCLQLLCNP